MEEYHTIEGYSKTGLEGMPKSVEDYLEMVSRLAQQEPAVRLSRLAEALHVSASSATRVARQLADMGFVHYKAYAYMRLTAKGQKAGAYLLYRHQVLQRFLTVLNGTSDELEETELIEHHLREKTVRNLERATAFLVSREFLPE